jgi:hypothetical protein
MIRTKSIFEKIKNQIPIKAKYTKTGVSVIKQKKCIIPPFSSLS